MKKAKYQSKIEVDLPIKSSKEVYLKLDSLGCSEFKLEHIEKKRYSGWIIVETDVPDMQVASKMTKEILERTLQILSIEYRVVNEYLKIHAPVLLNPEDLVGIEKASTIDRQVSVDVAHVMTEEKFNRIGSILQDIETYPSKEIIYKLVKVFDEYRQSAYDDKLEEGWKVMDLFIIQSRNSGIEGKSTIKLVNEFIDHHISKDDAIQITNKNKDRITKLSLMNIVNKDGIDRSKDLQQSIAAKNPKKILMSSLHCIYEVRNFKLHREESHDSYQISFALLEAFLREIWSIRLRDSFKQK